MKLVRQSSRDVGLDKIPLVAAVTTLILLQSPTAAAQDDEHRFSISAGIFVTDRDSHSRFDGDLSTTGTDVDLEADLGLDSSDSALRVDGYYRFNQRHRIDFSAFDLSRSASRVIQKDIQWNDTLFPVDTTLDSEFDLAIYKLAYTWSFMRREKGFLGLTAGLYVARFGTTLDAQEIDARESRDVTAPLPVIGLRGQYDFTEKLSFRASGEIFALEYEDYSGSLYDLYAGLDYQFFEHIALGVGINSVRLDIGVAKENFTGDLDWQYSGGLLYLKFDF